MIIVINGPLGIGKSTLAEALCERLEQSAMIDGDHLIALHPPPHDPVRYLHETVALLYAHHRRHGYVHAVVNHIWRTPDDLDQLRAALRGVETGVEIRCLLLTLPPEENLRRIARRQEARATDECAFERETVADERQVLYATVDGRLGEPFDVSAPPDALVQRLLAHLGLP